MNTFEIIMLGNASVGKTSMLAVLSKEIQKVNNICGVSFSSCGRTTTDLDDAWNDLIAQIQSGGLYRPIRSELGGTKDYVGYNFNLCFKGETRAKVDFIDTEGEFIKDVDGSGLLERTANALGAFCVIDASVLMECDSATNSRFNRPNLVADLLGKVFARDKHPQFVAFVLTKCETWMQTSENIQALREKFHAVYRDSIGLLQMKRINSYAMAIQTMGCVKFKSLVDVPDDKGRVLRLPQFVKTGNGVDIESHDCERPLIVAMKNILWKMRSEKGLWGRLLDILGMGDDIDTYINQLANLKLEGRRMPNGDVQKRPCFEYYEELASDYRG